MRFTGVVRALLIAGSCVTAASCRNDAQSEAGSVPVQGDTAPSDRPAGDVIDPNMTVDTQRVPGMDTLTR